MKKLNWHKDFLKLVADRSKEEFSWGNNDCVLFASDVVKLIHTDSLDPANDARGHYTTKAGATRYLKANHNGSLEDAWNSKLTRRENVYFAQPGDVALFITDMGPTSGIVWFGPDLKVYAPSPEGVKAFPVDFKDLIAAWEV